jgi:hypothetical protein
MLHKFKLITGVKVWEVQQLTTDTYKIIATGFPNLKSSNFTIKGSFESIKDKFRLATQDKTCKKGCVNKCKACARNLLMVLLLFTSPSLFAQDCNNVTQKTYSALDSVFRAEQLRLLYIQKRQRRTDQFKADKDCCILRMNAAKKKRDKLPKC